MDFTLVQGNLLPKLRATLTDADGALDLTGLASDAVTLNFQTPGFSGSGTCTIIDASAGIVEYTWASGDTDLPGLYLARFDVDFAGAPESFPNDSWIEFEILPKVPQTAPASSTPFADFIEPVRAFLGDHDDALRMYEDDSIIRCARSLVRCGELAGYGLTNDKSGISPLVTSPKTFGLLVWKTCKAFVNPQSQSYSYRTRALSESFGDNKTFLFNLENAIYDNEQGDMFTSFQNFYGWINAITGINLWSHLTDLKTHAPVAQISVGRDGVKVTSA